MGRACREVSVALVGIGGYGNQYLSTLFERGSDHGLRLVGLADPQPASCRFLAEIERRKIPIYPDFQALRQQHDCDLAIVCTPLHLHCEHTLAALESGCDVLCEKPLASTPLHASEMMIGRDKAAKQVSIGYQWSFSVAIQALKRDIAAGLFGRPRRLKTLVLWPRGHAYYKRNDWAGKRYSKTKEPIFDNPLNNACAHHLHNMMYVLGERPDRSAMPLSISGELYRANDIETFDTAAVRVFTTDEVEVLCYVSHATKSEQGPSFIFEFEDATIEFAGRQPTDMTKDGETVFARFHDGRVKQYGSPERAPDRKLWAAAESVRTQSPSVCGIEAALSHTLLVDALHRGVHSSVAFEPPLKHVDTTHDGQQRVWIEGLDDVLRRCYATGQLPYEMQIPWAQESMPITIPQRLIYPVEMPRKVVDRLQIHPFATKRPEPV